jgi:hypothetical protein
MNNQYGCDDPVGHIKECKAAGMHNDDKGECMTCGHSSFVRQSSEEQRLLERSMVNLIRSIMYAGEDGENDAGNDGSLMIAEVQELANQLAEYDGVLIEAEDNRLLLALKTLKRKKPKCFRRIERINGI